MLWAAMGVPANQQSDHCSKESDPITVMVCRDGRIINFKTR